MTIFNFKLPDLGEGLPDAEIIAWHVNVGDSIKTDQLLLSVETAKAVIDIPSPCDGVVEQLCFKPGDLPRIGQVLVVFRTEVSTEAVDAGTVVGKMQVTDHILQEINVTLGNKIVDNNVKAVPAVRALAKKLQLDINQITPTGEGNTITIDDVQKASSISISNNVNNTVSDGWITLHQTARTMALAMQKSHNEVVPATIFEDLILPDYKNDVQFDITVSLIQAIAYSCTKEPAINSWIRYDNHNFKQKIFTNVNLGIAIDSPEGLFVPVIKKIASKSSDNLRTELNLLIQQIKTRSLIPEQLQDATFILSNFGKFAGRYAVPVVVSPMVGILAVGSLRQAMVVLDGAATISYVLPLSLTFDHRAVTGGQAARFLKAIIEFFK